MLSLSLSLSSHQVSSREHSCTHQRWTDSRTRRRTRTDYTPCSTWVGTHRKNSSPADGRWRLGEHPYCTCPSPWPKPESPCQGPQEIPSHRLKERLQGGAHKPIVGQREDLKTVNSNPYANKTSLGGKSALKDGLMRPVRILNIIKEESFLSCFHLLK